MYLYPDGQTGGKLICPATIRRGGIIKTFHSTNIGLGDRHGENILFDSTNGDCVHVDFNCLFNKVYICVVGAYLFRLYSLLVFIYCLCYVTVLYHFFFDKNNTSKHTHTTSILTKPTVCKHK
jgi:hypothetical protein